MLQIRINRKFPNLPSKLRLFDSKQKIEKIVNCSLRSKKDIDFGPKMSYSSKFGENNL